MTAEQINWDTIPLRSLCLETTTVDPTRTPDRVFEYVDVSAVSNDLWKIVGSTRHTGATAPGRARKLVRAQDVIFATVRPSLKRIALVPQNLDEQVVSTAFCVLRADPTKADPRFIYYSLLTEDFVSQVSNLERGASYPAVTDKDILEQEIVVPPLPEQRAIAAALSRIQAAVGVQKKIVATLKELKAATMAKLFREGLRGEPLKQTEIGEIPESWKVVRAGDAVSISQGQVDPRIDPYASMIHIGPENVEPDTGRLLECRTAREIGLISGKYLFQPGNIVYSKIRPYLRKAVLADFTGICSADMYPLTPKEGFEGRYLHALFLSQIFTSQAVSQQTRTGIPKLNREQLNNILVPKPSRPEQEEIGRLIASISQRTSAAIHQLDTLKSLFSSMLHLLMTGQVRVTQKMIALQALEDRKKKQKKYSGKIDEKSLQEIVQRIVEAVQPEKIILFGSAARGEMGPDSDVDLLVVKACNHPREESRLIRRKLIGIGMPVDALVTTPQHLEEHKDTIGYIYRPALREGMVLYAK